MGTVHVSGYDPDGDGVYSILTSTGEGTRGHVKAFDQNLDVFLSFFSAAEGDFSGCDVIGGDLDGDGSDDIATGTVLELKPRFMFSMAIPVSGAIP